MFPEREQQDEGTYQVEQWYKYQEELVQAKFKEINTDALEEIRNKMRKRQTKNENQENIELIEQERVKIIEKMKEHTAECRFPGCNKVQEITMCYQLLNMGKGGIDDLKKDNVVLIVRYGSCTGFTQTACPVGSQLNKKMMETHRILKGI